MYPSNNRKEGKLTSQNTPTQKIFRADLEVIPSKNRSGSETYLVQDSITGELFEFGEEEFFLCRQLDGKNSLDEIQEKFENHYHKKLDRNQLEAFVKQIEEEGLLEGCPRKPQGILHLFQFQPPETWKSWKLFNPETICNWLAGNLSWCYSRPFVIGAFSLLALAAGVVFHNFNDFLRDIKFLFKPLTIFQVFTVIYFFVNIPQELARGMTSIRFSGRPYEFGIRLTFNYIPRFYCLTKLWEVRDRVQRSWILFTPSFYSIIAASTGILFWKIMKPNIFLHELGLILSVICIVDLIIRLNFFWPTEAYTIISNWFDIQNLRKRALKVAKAWIFRSPMPEPLSSRKRRLLTWYGLLTAFATVSTLVLVAYFAGKALIHSLAGTGALIFFAAVIVKYRKGIFVLLKENSMFERLSNISLEVRNKKVTRLVFWTVSLIVIALFPYPYEAGGPFKILPLENIELHTQVDGEIKKVFIREDDLVKKGDLQAIIDNREHQKNLDATQAELEKAISDLRLLENGPKPEEVKKAKKIVETAKTQLDYSKKEEERLGALLKEGVISQEEYVDAARKADVDAKNVDVVKANLELVESGPRPEEIEANKAIVRDLQARLKYYKENVELTKLLAPISGRVVTPYIETKVGQVLKEGDLFAVYENAETIQTEIQLPEADIDEIKIGSRVKIRPQAYPTRFFYGTVVLIAPSATDTRDGKVVRVISTIPNPDMELRPQMTGEAKIEGGWEPLIVAFSKAIVRFFMVEVWSWFP